MSYYKEMELKPEDREVKIRAKYDECETLKKEVEIAVEALKFYDGVHRLNWAIDLSRPQREAKEALEKIKELEK